jgi:Family of unknown function (DUF6152)
MKLRSLVLLVAVMCCSSIVSPHHSFAIFDRDKLTTLSGTVREWKWVNPHTWLTVVVRKSDGTDEEWALVGSSPNMMSRWGWNAADIQAGDKLTVDIHPARDGRTIGQIQTVFLLGGKILADPGGQTGENLAGGPTNLPTKPQGVPYK